jgi:choline dehydrogenase-like flavoprotein
MRDGGFRKEHAPYRLDFTNISRVDGTTTALIAAGIYGPEFERRLRHSAARELNVKTVLEVLPHPENRITLSAQKDSMGLPKPEAHYMIDEYTHRGAIRALDDFRQIAARMGGTNLRFTRDGDYANNQHICGTLMMGNDPATSVVDRWGRAHDHENLYMASTGVIPTAGTCNSTENGLALALHTVHHILGGRDAAPTKS